MRLTQSVSRQWCTLAAVGPVHCPFSQGSHHTLVSCTWRKHKVRDCFAMQGGEKATAESQLSLIKQVPPLLLLLLLSNYKLL